jgi:hypoxanthine phosphoribosyltransferase
MNTRDAWALFNNSDLLFGEHEIVLAFDRVASEITALLADRLPLVLTVMNGGVVFAGQLLPRLAFPLDCDYLHATRYRDTTVGSGINWCALPRKAVEGRSVLVLDDILDEGITLAAIRAKLLEMGAAEVWIAVLAETALAHAKPVRADFVGLTVPDRYVFGMGMDAYGLWRNLPGIYAIKGD